MTRRRRVSILVGLCAVILAGVLVVVLPSGTKQRGGEGTVRFVGSADSSFDQYTVDKNASYGAFLRSHMWRMIAYAPYFNDKTSWYPKAWLYQDAYAIYHGSLLSKQHPEWILHDAAKNPLDIPFACSAGVCPQYAADISNAAFRSHWIAEAKAQLLHGYRGLFIDDVNMEFRVSNGQGQETVPIDRLTHKPMTYEAWRSYMAQFMEQIRRAIPKTEVVHNVIWFANSPTRTADPYIRREIAAANYVNLEHAVSGLGATNDTSHPAFSTFLAYIDAVHALGAGVILDSHETDRHPTEYALASYFLISEGMDGFTAGGMTPTHWWRGFDVNLGNAVGPRKNWNGVLRRDFAAGMVLVNEPGAASQTISLTPAMRDLDGRRVTSVTLAPASGVVLKSL